MFNFNLNDFRIQISDKCEQKLIKIVILLSSNSHGSGLQMCVLEVETVQSSGLGTYLVWRVL